MRTALWEEYAIQSGHNMDPQSHCLLCLDLFCLSVSVPILIYTASPYVEVICALHTVAGM